jgi:hypothetical protein
MLERAAPLFSEYVRFERSIPEIRRAQGEADDAFNPRVRVLQLVNSEETLQREALALGF